MNRTKTACAVSKFKFCVDLTSKTVRVSNGHTSILWCKRYGYPLKRRDGVAQRCKKCKEA